LAFSMCSITWLPTLLMETLRNGASSLSFGTGGDSFACLVPTA
jgi:hypothetical protein